MKHEQHLHAPEPTLDLSAIIGADDFVAKVKTEQEIATGELINTLVGSPTQGGSNAWALKALAEADITSTPWKGVAYPLQFARMVDQAGPLDPTIPRTREARDLAMQANETAFGLLKDIFLALPEEAETYTEYYEEGHTRITTVTPTMYGFAFQETKIYFPGHNPIDDPLPDNFYAEASLLETPKHPLSD